MESRKLTWIDWTYYSACLALMGYTVYVVYTLKDEGTGKLRMLRMARSVCKSTAETVGKWGIKADLAYNRLIDLERMN